LIAGGASYNVPGFRAHWLDSDTGVQYLQRSRRTMAEPLVGVVMGSKSDWDTMSHAADTLEALGIPHEVRVMSAHRTPDQAIEYAATARERGLEVIIAAAGGAAHLAGVLAAKTTLPVLGVPMKGWSLDGLDSLLSTVQMPRGVPVGTLAIGKAGAVNAALFAGQILGLKHSAIRKAVDADREARRQEILDNPDPRK
jgi:5-(carboxyamino)imidazole ribonucleotide mutase